MRSGRAVAREGTAAEFRELNSFGITRYFADSEIVAYDSLVCELLQRPLRLRIGVFVVYVLALHVYVSAPRD